jgi:glycosyltransferase involved in cell wall biosynthesis
MLQAQLRYIVSRGVQLTLISDAGQELETVAADVGAAAVGIPMRRDPAPRADVVSLWKLIGLFRRSSFDIVHSSTPKAGLLAAVAGTIARVPIRMHTYTGQPWVELYGIRRWFPRESDRIVSMLATQLYADSPSQRAFLIQERLVDRRKIAIVGAGSIAGVDFERFSLNKWGGKKALETRSELGISAEASVIIFVGRINRDKGIVELVAAFEKITAEFPDGHLLLVGPLESERNLLPIETLHTIKRDRRIHLVGFTAMPEKYLAAADIFCLPSYREGFGSVVVEAAAMKLPAVVTRITGLVDTVVDGVTGLLVPAKDGNGLARALKRLLDSKGLRSSLGHAGWQRALATFDSTQINEALFAEYFRLASRLPGLRLNATPIEGNGRVVK